MVDLGGGAVCFMSEVPLFAGLLIKHANMFFGPDLCTILLSTCIGAATSILVKFCKYDRLMMLLSTCACMTSYMLVILCRVDHFMTFLSTFAGAATYILDNFCRYHHCTTLLRLFWM